MASDVRDLVSRSLAGEQSAMVRLVQRFERSVFGLCYRMLGQRQDAEDMAQETFARALKHLDHWDGQREFEPWLLTIAGNRCRSLLASRLKRPPPLPLEEPVVDRHGELFAAKQLAEEVELALAGLREEYRQAFLLFHEQELSYAEIGALLDCPLGTVKTWVHRARRELIERLSRRGVVQETPHEVRRV